MILGSYQIVACPPCGGLARYQIMLSGNTFGAIVWTDGNQWAPMLLQPPMFVRCRHCHAFYWLADAPKVGTYEPSSEQKTTPHSAWADAQEVEEPGPEEYYQALKVYIPKDATQEKTLRILAWWRDNDIYRRRAITVSRALTELSQAFKTNLGELSHLLNKSDEHDRLMLAELHRELGEFELSQQVLEGIRSNEYQSVVCQLRELCAARDHRLREFRLDRPDVPGFPRSKPRAS